MSKKLIGSRPPLLLESRKQVRDIADWLNKEALKEFTDHDALVLIIDRAWSILHPDKVSEVKRKKYEKIPF